VNRALVDALDLRRAALRLAGVDLALELDYELPPAWADAHQLQQVFLNLITNAEYALAGHDGARRLTLRSRPAARAGGAAWIAVEVSDSGPGLAPGEELRVFEPFYTTKPEGAGTGLGLAVSAGIVREHGGELRAERGPGGGATFVVELPAGGVPHGRRPRSRERRGRRPVGGRSGRPLAAPPGGRPGAVRPRDRPRRRRRGRHGVHGGARRPPGGAGRARPPRPGERLARAGGDRPRAPRRPRRRRAPHRRLGVRARRGGRRDAVDGGARARLPGGRRGRGRRGADRPAAVLFDLLPLGRFDRRPTPAMAYAACDAARPLAAEQGSVGAGAGLTVGKALGRAGAMKGGVGVADAWAGGVGVAAVAAVNAFGDVRDAAGRVLAGARGPGGRFAGETGTDAAPGAPPHVTPASPFANTTLAVVAASRPLDRVALAQLARAAAAALYRRITPAAPRSTAT
jgi:hypothetical protein